MLLESDVALGYEANGTRMTVRLLKSAEPRLDFDQRNLQNLLFVVLHLGLDIKLDTWGRI